ncbi:hypothetical protein [Sphingomonas sp. 3-13AW]|uniref:hypothetical protein n=1 Tax=Sphingomonas sp. 3-13AW TaxID=3050450 RepID=UPI003BB6D25C
MTKETVDLATFRSAMKALGYQVSARSGSMFITASVKRGGKQINGGNVLTPEHLEEHREFYNYKARVSVLDGSMRVMF